MKTTRQGVRDLNDQGHRNPARRKSVHRHFFVGPLVVVGYRNVSSDVFGDMEVDPIYAQRCLHCGTPGTAY